MCDPVSLTIAATAVMAVGQGVSAIQQSQAASYQAKVADRNAQLSAQQGQDAQERGRQEELRQYRKTAQLMGAQRASMAANGIDPDFGSAAGVAADTAMIGQEDASTVRKNWEHEVQGYDIQSSNFQADAAAKRQASSAALINGAFSMGSTILGGAKQVSSINAGLSPNLGGANGGAGYDAAARRLAAYN